MITLQLERLIKEKGGVTKLAKILGVNRQTIYYYINQGEKNSVETLEKIASALDINIKDLFSIKEELTALVDHKGEYYKAQTLEELEKIVQKIKENS